MFGGKIGRLFLTGLAVATWMTTAAGAQTAPDSSPPAPKRWPVEAFARLPFVESPSLSPDGSRIAARIAVDGEQRLAIIDLRKRGPEGTRVLGMGENDLNWWTWVNDDWLIAGIGAEQYIDGQAIYLRRVVGVEATGAKINFLAKKEAAQNADDVIWRARDGTPRILLAYQTSIYLEEGFWPQVAEVDVSTGRLRTVVKPRNNVMDWYADAAGVVRMGVGYNDSQRTSTLLYRSRTADPFKVVDRASRRRDETMIVPELFLAEPGKALARDARDGTAALYEFDLATLQLGKKVFEAPGYDIDRVLWDKDGTQLGGVYYTDTRARVKWFDADLAEVQSAIDKAVGSERFASIVSTSQTQQRLIVHVAAADMPGAYYFFDRAGGVMNKFAEINPDIGMQRLAPVRTIKYKARDGLEIAAVLTLPQGRDPKKLPFILMPHGGPFARDEEQWDWWVQFLANRGYAVIQPNYRGSSGFGTAFAEKGEGQWGLAMQDDLNDAVDWAVKEGIADPARVCIVGASYGGYAAMRAAQRDPTKFRCAVSYAGVSDLGSMMRYDGRFLYHGTRSDWMKDQAPDYAAVSPINFAGNFGVPILLMHGKKDRRVQVKQSREMAEKLKQAGKTYIYIEQPLGDHHFSREQDRLEFLTQLEAFLAKYNPA